MGLELPAQDAVIQHMKHASTDGSEASAVASPWRHYIAGIVLAAAGWWIWEYFPPIANTPFYATYLYFEKAPVALPLPVAGVAQRQLANTWHAARGSERRHEGIDIFARRGTPVLSTTEGIVLRMGVNSLGGKVVWVLGPGGQRHYYAHLDEYAAISVGGRVHPGTQLGMVGNTGNARSTPPHLHYGIYGRGGALNPYPLLKAGAVKPWPASQPFSAA